MYPRYAMAPSMLIVILLAASTATALDVSILHAKPQPGGGAAASPVENVLALARNDAARLAFLTSKASAGPAPTIPVASGQQVLQNPTYIVKAGLGSPAQQLLLALDTSADAMWAPCSPCSSCPSSTQFAPNKSSSYSPLPCTSSICALFQSPPCPAAHPGPMGQDGATAPACSYTQPFADSGFTATLSQDTLQLGRDALTSYAFGCVGSVNGPTSNLPKQGLLGLGRGPMSLISQSGGLYKGVFSYCLPSYKSYYFSGSLRLGPAGQPRGVRYTPLLKNPHRPSLYYVNVTGISVGRASVQAPAGSFGFDPATGAGTIIDSGTVISRFTSAVYTAVRDEFRKQLAAPSGYSSLGAFDTCFDTSEVGAAAPAVTLHMDGGVDLTLPSENTLIHSSATPLACLAMAAAPDNVNSVVNVIANLQQQNLRVVVDVGAGRVGFAREACN